jgi:pimeloyl-ACP methyl ester carboxylesterase
MKSAILILFSVLLVASPIAARELITSDQPAGTQFNPKNLALPPAQEDIKALNNEETDCPFPMPDDEVINETIVCGEMTVPENWDNPGSQTVTIGYAILKSPSLSPFPDPVIYLEGGPGSSALSTLPYLRDVFAELRRYRDVVIYDQRGNSYSSPLACPDEIAGQEIEDLPEGPSELSINSDLEDFINSAKNSSDYRTAVNCAPYFAEQGIDLSQYSTASSVLDLIALMDTLNYVAYNLYGISYGTNVALELFRYYDENDSDPMPVVRSGIIDGNVPPNIDTRGGQAFTLANNILRLFAECEEDSECGAAFPNIRQRTIDLLQQTAEAPLEIGDETITVDNLVSVMNDSFNFKLSDQEEIQGIGAAYLPLMVSELENGIADTYVALREGTLPPEPGTSSLPSGPLGIVASESVSLADDARALAEQIEAFSLQSKRAADALESDKPLPEFFLEELRLGVFNLDSLSAKTFPAFVQIPLQTTSGRDALLGIASLVSDDLVALVPLMSDADVDKTLEMVLEAMPTLKIVYDITNVVITCNDRYESLALEEILASYQAYEIPALLNRYNKAFNEKIACDAWGLTPEDTDLKEPVTSDLPILVSNGTMDPETPLEWGEAAAEKLTNATVFTTIYGQHGSTGLFDCGKAVAAAFIMYPEQEVDLACADDFRESYPFVLEAPQTTEE